MGGYYSTLSVEEQKKYLNFKCSPHDPRDYIYKPRFRGVLPRSVDLRPNMPPVVDQGHLGSCVANAIAGAYEYTEKPRNDWAPSRLFLYYNAREIEGTVDQDSGAYIRDGIKSLVKKGICSETMWPYDISKFTEKPPQECYDEAAKHKILTYRRIDDPKTKIKQALANGYPVAFGFTVFESFMTPEVASTGIMPMPKEGEQILGRHAILCCGFNDDEQMFIIRNSWSADHWGDKGYFKMPYEFLFNPEWCEDYWFIMSEA